MVFSGQPSTGCQMCRTRRIKCDEGKPACNQCLRTNRTCPGYKNKIDLLFRNETGATAAEKRARTAARKKVASVRSRQGSRAAVPAVPAEPVPGVPPSVPLAARPSAYVGSHKHSGGGTGPSRSGSSSSPTSSGGVQGGHASSSSIGSGSGGSSGSSASGPNSGLGGSIGISPDLGIGIGSSSGLGCSSSLERSSNKAVNKASISYVMSNQGYDEYAHYDEDLGTGYYYDSGYSSRSSGSGDSPYQQKYSPSEGGDDGSGSSATGGASGLQNAIVDRNNTIVPALSLPADELAVCHFFANFVLVPTLGTNRGYMDFLIPLLHHVESPTSPYAAALTARDAHHAHRQMVELAQGTSSSTSTTRALVSMAALPLPHLANEARDALTFAFRACALAAMGTRVSSNGFAFGDKALSAYTRALAATHLALKDPALQREDTTLAAVLMLSLFESITSKRMSLFAWGSHIEGAIEIAKTRTEEQRQTRTGLSLFLAVRTQMIIHSITSEKSPHMSEEWWLSSSITESAASAGQALGIRTAQLRSDSAEVLAEALLRTPENAERVLELVWRAKELDALLVEWASNTPPEYRYWTVAYQGPLPPGTNLARAEAFPGRIDAYQDFYVASVWNMMRSMRLVTSCIEMRCVAWLCAPTDYRETPQYAAARDLSRAVMADTMASVPFYLCGPQALRQMRGVRHVGGAVPQPARTGFVVGDDSALKGLAGYFLTWPLNTLNRCDYLTDDERAWVTGRLRHISTKLGVRFAGFLSHLTFRTPSMLVRNDMAKMKDEWGAEISYERAMRAKQARDAAAMVAAAAAAAAERPAAEKTIAAQHEADYTALVTEATGNADISVKWIVENMLDS